MYNKVFGQIFVRNLRHHSIHRLAASLELPRVLFHLFHTFANGLDQGVHYWVVLGHDGHVQGLGVELLLDEKALLLHRV